MKNLVLDILWYKRAKKDWLWLTHGAMLGVQSLSCYSIEISGFACLMPISELIVYVTFKGSSTLSAGKVKLHSELGSRNSGHRYHAPLSDVLIYVDRYIA